jgi:membrane protein DedA with SNARE-associated domain
LRGIWSYLQALAATLGAWGPWGILLLGFLDSAGIPVAVAMDLLIVLLAVNEPHLWLLGAAMGVLGSVAGNFLLFSAARKGGERFVDRAPASGRTRHFRDWFDRYGLTTVFIPALVPIPLPLKIFVISAGVLGTPLRTFLLVILAARVLRYGGLAWLGLQLGNDAEGFLRENVWPLTVFAALLAAGIFGLLKLSERRRRPA